MARCRSKQDRMNPANNNEEEKAFIRYKNYSIGNEDNNSRNTNFKEKQSEARP